MTAIPFELARIEDEQLRNRAIEIWLAGLSEQECQELSDTVYNLVMGFVPFIEAVGETCRQIVDAFGNWIEDNPEIKAYLAELDKAKKYNQAIDDSQP